MKFTVEREAVKPEIGTGAVRIVGSSLLVAKRVAWLRAFRVLRGTRKSLESKVYPPSAVLSTFRSTATEDGLRRTGSLKSGSGRGQWPAWGAKAAWPGKLFGFASSHLCCSSRHRRCHLLQFRHDFARAVGGTLCPVLGSSLFSVEWGEQRPLPPAHTVAAPDPHRSLPVVPLIADKRYYGETPVRLPGGPAGRSGAGLNE
jgi:hypothetical protein